LARRFFRYEVNRQRALSHERVFGFARRMPDHNVAQRAVLSALLAAHPRMLGIDELVAKFPEIPRVREAMRVLVDDGLATRLGDRVGCSRAAVRFDGLTPV
jgi:hypothetical protein